MSLNQKELFVHFRLALLYVGVFFTVWITPTIFASPACSPSATGC